MKFRNLVNALTAFTLFFISVNALAAVKHYENTNTNGFIFGSYDFDNENNIFSNINLKVNFSAVGGPSDVKIQAPKITLGSDELALYENIVTDGSSSNSYYSFTSGILVFSSSPHIVILTQMQRFELLYFGGMGPIDYLTPTNKFDDYFITFTERTGNISAVPEPESISLLILGMILLGAKISRKNN